MLTFRQFTVYFTSLISMNCRKPMLHSLLLNWFIALAALVNPAGEAKSAITMTPATIDTTFLVSISNRHLDLGMQTVITNNTTSPL